MFQKHPTLQCIYILCLYVHLCHVHQSILNIACFIDSITTANSIDYEKCKIFQPLRNLFEGGKKGTKCTYLVVVVLELPSLHYLDISPPKNYNIHSFHLVF